MREEPTRRHVLALGAAAMLAPPAWAQAPAVPPVQRVAGRTFGTEWRLSLPDGVEAETFRPDLEHLLATIDRQMSPWREDSEITAFNRAPAGSLAVSAGTATVAQAALEIAGESGGWFDPTVGPLVARWGFGPIRGAAAEPGGPPLWHGLRAEEGAIAKTAPGLTMDLCGIAKGRALDLMVQALEAAGQGDFLIDLGGELAARGRHPTGRDWQVAVEDPRPDGRGSVAVLALNGRAVATSGSRAQSYRLGDTRYGHIMDPRRAGPVRGTLASVSVIADRAMQADGWATALAAAGEEGPALARRRGIAALFLFAEAGGLRSVATGGFERHMLG